jgi:tryptophanase
MKGTRPTRARTAFYALKDAVKTSSASTTSSHHQGRAAENIVFGTLVKKGQHILFNMPFDTTKGGTSSRTARFPLIGVVDEAFDPALEAPFKGNVDIAKLEAAIAKYGTDDIPLSW